MLGYRGQNNDRILNHMFHLAKYYIFVTKCREKTLNLEQFKRKKNHKHIIWERILPKEYQIRV